jgi:hypothetical protein
VISPFFGGFADLPGWLLHARLPREDALTNEEVLDRLKSRRRKVPSLSQRQYLAAAHPIRGTGCSQKGKVSGIPESVIVAMLRVS